MLVAACDDSGPVATPTSPSAPPVVSAPQAPVPRLLSGYVADTAWRVLGGVTVEVIQGPDAGMVLTSDLQGRFSYTGLFSSPVVLRASKDGFVSITEPARLLSSGGAYVAFQLSPLTPPVPMTGTYTLTISAGAACTGLPETVRTRTYAATVSPNAFSRDPNSSFRGLVTTGQFAPYGNAFYVGVAGNFLSISTQGEGPSIIELVGTNSYVAFNGNAEMIADASAQIFSAAFVGDIEYCELKAPIGSYYDCRSEFAAVREVCSTNEGRLTLTRR